MFSQKCVHHEVPYRVPSLTRISFSHLSFILTLSSLIFTHSGPLIISLFLPLPRCLCLSRSDAASWHVWRDPGTRWRRRLWRHWREQRHVCRYVRRRVRVCMWAHRCLGLMLRVFACVHTHIIEPYVLMLTPGEPKTKVDKMFGFALPPNARAPRTTGLWQVSDQPSLALPL